MDKPIALVIKVVAQKNAEGRAIVEFVFVERTKAWPADRTKHVKEWIVRCVSEQTLERCLAMKNWCREAINQIHSSAKGLRPILLRNRCRGE